MDNESKTEKKIELPIKRKHLDGLIFATGAFAALDFVITPALSQMITGEYKTLHEYLGLPPDMSELGIRIGGMYWNLTMVYELFLRKKFMGKTIWD